MDKDQKLKLILISGAAHALDYKDKNPNSNTYDIIQYITDEAENILNKMDEEP